MGEDKEHLILFAKQYVATHPDIDYFIFGNRHIEFANIQYAKLLDEYYAE